MANEAVISEKAHRALLLAETGAQRDLRGLAVSFEQNLRSEALRTQIERRTQARDNWMEVVAEQRADELERRVFGPAAERQERAHAEQIRLRELHLAEAAERDRIAQARFEAWEYGQKCEAERRQAEAEARRAHQQVTQWRAQALEMERHVEEKRRQEHLARQRAAHKAEMEEARDRLVDARRQRQEAMDAQLEAHKQYEEMKRQEKQAEIDEKVERVAQLERGNREAGKLAERRRLETQMARDEIWDLMYKASVKNTYDDRIRKRFEELGLSIRVPDWGMLTYQMDDKGDATPRQGASVSRMSSLATERPQTAKAATPRARPQSASRARPAAAAFEGRPQPPSAPAAGPRRSAPPHSARQRWAAGAQATPGKGDRNAAYGFDSSATKELAEQLAAAARISALTQSEQKHMALTAAPSAASPRPCSPAASPRQSAPAPRQWPHSSAAGGRPQSAYTPASPGPPAQAPSAASPAKGPSLKCYIHLARKPASDAGSAPVTAESTPFRGAQWQNTFHGSDRTDVGLSPQPRGPGGSPKGQRLRSGSPGGEGDAAAGEAAAGGEKGRSSSPGRGRDAPKATSLREIEARLTS